MADSAKTINLMLYDHTTLAESLFFPGLQCQCAESYLRHGPGRQQSPVPHLVARWRKLLSKYRARKWMLELDGERISDRYRRFEGLNICPVARFPISRRTRRQEMLMDYLADRSQGEKEPDFPLPVRKFQRLRIG